MAKVKYITSANEIPAEQKFLLVMYGQGYAQTRYDFALTITVARQQSKTVSELSFWTTVRTAKGIAKQGEYPRFLSAPLRHHGLPRLFLIHGLAVLRPA